MAQHKLRGRDREVERKLLAALDAHLPHGRARVTLRLALEKAGISTPPDEPAGLGLFVCGALADQIEQEASREVTETLIEVLEPMFMRGDAKSSGVRRQTPRIESRTVILLSRTGAQAEPLEEALRRKVPLTLVRDAFTLIDALDGITARELTLVIASDAPSFGGPILETVQRSVPEHTELVFWGHAVPAALRLPYTRTEASTSGKEVAELCLTDPAPEVERPRIVIADDDDAWRAVLERALRRAGYDVAARADGFEALEACVDERPALVITDFQMPLIDGRQLAYLLSTRFAPDPPPVLMVTASQLEDAGLVDAMFDKGGRLEVLLDAVRERVPVVEPEEP